MIQEEKGHKSSFGISNCSNEIQPSTHFYTNMHEMLLKVKNEYMLQI